MIRFDILRGNHPLLPPFDCPQQTQERIDVALFAEKGAIPAGWLLLEEAQGWQDDAGGSHETQSTRHRGEWAFRWMPGWRVLVVIICQWRQIRDRFHKKYSNDIILSPHPLHVVHLRLLCALCHTAYLPSPVLLAVTGEQRPTDSQDKETKKLNRKIYSFPPVLVIFRIPTLCWCTI